MADGGGQSAGRSGARWKPKGSYNGDETEDPTATYAQRFADVDRINDLDAQMGFGAFASGPPRMGWMINMSATYVKDAEWPSGRSAVDYYFLQEDGGYFKTSLVYSPYFFVKCKMGKESEVEDGLRRKFDKLIERIEKIQKDDLDLPNHLSGIKRNYLKLYFRNTGDLDKVKRVLQPIATRNGEAYRDGIIPIGMMSSAKPDDGNYKKTKAGEAGGQALDNVVDLREHDVPYALRVSIDHGICVGLWYNVKINGPTAQISVIRDKDVRPDPVILAFDIETSKSPLKFPDAAVDAIMMISYMINGQGFLITNRDIVSQDIEDFEYTPKPDYPGTFTIFNETDEKALLNRFFAHIQLMRPTIIATYNGDFFDWPYVEARALHHGMDMEALIGFKKNNQGEYWATQCLHMDCFKWVKRDSYLPAGSQGLKAVTAAKLGYDPLELDPEMMTPLASSDPQTLANYSVSDAVATYYLYMKYVHPFIFSLCNIIPLSPDDVLRKGSGTLCETLLMAEAFKANVIMPNKHSDEKERFHGGHLLESETYIGGHVEALEAGVFRSDIPSRFRLDPDTLQTLIKDVDRALKFSLKAEGGVSDFSLVKNYDEVRGDIIRRLEELRDNPNRNDKPLIYHLDVAAMYPNIILSNRLQPTAMVDEGTCAQCDHNRPGKTCQRRMTWSWRGEMYTAKKNEYRMIKSQLEAEMFPTKVRVRGVAPNAMVTKQVPYHELPEAEQKSLLQKRLAEYSQKAYRRIRKTEVVEKESIVCQKEHAFYIDTVRSFRDRRYDYKNLHKKAKKMADEAVEAKDAVRIEECKKLVVLYDSLQLAHKCILNSFYGYVMRKGARWYSMEMAGIVCQTGSSIIQLARQLVERVGRPLELDTDGIWCMLPWDFPQGYAFQLEGGKRHAFDYPCVMLNHLVHDRFTNDQYHTLVDPVKRIYEQSSENSIFFEIDGPYRAMIIPSSTEEGKQLKKRYAVFNENGSLAELKGFEVKRRGELKFVKVFQTQIFKVYLEGATLAECYAKVAAVANYWLDILHGHGKMLEEHDLVDLISENRSMSRALEDYGEQKSTSICTAKRLAEFLGDQMVKDKGLACKFVISRQPVGTPVTTRAIPIAIFAAEESVKRHYLRKWLKDASLTDFDMRSIIDWAYYLERLGSMIQKLIVIPAHLQAVPNPCPRVAPPDWLLKIQASELAQERVQSKIGFAKTGGTVSALLDMEDIGRVKMRGAMIDMKGVGAKAEPLEEQVDLVAERRLMEEDYRGWVASQKRRWQNLREQIANPGAAAAAKQNGSASAFSRLQESDKDLVTRKPWQIVSIEPTETLGEFLLWAVIAGAPTARSFRLHLQRRIYLLFRNPQDLSGDYGKFLTKVYRKLPSGRDGPNLYEFSCDEGVWVTEYHRLASLLNDAELEGVFEAEVPLEFDAVLRLGSTVMLAPEVRRLRDAQSRFIPDDFQFCTTVEVPYLAGGQQRFISLVQLGSSETRQALLLGIPQANRSTLYRMVIVESGMRRQLPANLKSFLPQPSEEGMDADTSDLFFKLKPDVVSIEVDMQADAAGAMRLIGRIVQEQIDAKQGPLIVLSNAGNHFRDHAAFGKVPVLQIPALTGSLQPPALDWQRWSGRKAFEFVAALNPWLRDRLSLARYAHIPLGNLAEDAYPQLADTFFARTLRASGHLIWWHQPGAAKAQPGDLAAVWETCEAAPSIKAPGLYRTVCVEADLTGLAINAVMEHASIAAEETADVAIGADGKAMAGALQAGPHAALLSILKKLLTGWLRDSVHNGQAHAQQLAATLHRWLKSPWESRLYYEPLHRRVQSLINRSLALLVARLHQIGCMVIHCDANRLVLRTSRTDLHNAVALMRFLAEELKRQDAFGWVDFTPTRYWRLLAWMDPANFHGFAYEDSDGEDDVGEPATIMKWSVAEFLPPMLQPVFKRVIQDYLHRAYARLGGADAAANAMTDGADGLPVAKGGLVALVPAEDEQEEEEEDAVDSDFCQLFLRILREAQRFLAKPPRSEEEQASRQFPQLLGSHLALSDPLLEFVKACGAVFRLDAQTNPRQGEQLLKLAFALLNVREFSDATAWVNPCLSWTLSDVICPACAHCRDLDFCRDPATGGDLACDACGHPYDLEALQSEMISLVRVDLEAYQRQDLACRSCAAVKADAMQQTCLRCATGFKTTGYDAKTLRGRVQVAGRIAERFGLVALKLYVDALHL